MIQGIKKTAAYLYLLIIVVFLYAPIITLIVLSFNRSRSMAVWLGFSFDWYKRMAADPMIIEAIWNTFFIALASAFIATIIGTLGAIGVAGMRKSTRTAIMTFNNIPLLNADIVIGISLMITYLIFGISLSRGTVLLSHITFSLPYVILSVMPKLKQTARMNYEAALDLGATPIYAFVKVVLPDVLPGIISGFLLAFTMSVDDFVVTHFTRNRGDGFSVLLRRLHRSPLDS